MSDLNRRAIIQRIARRLRSNMYIPVYHTNGRSIQNMIGVVVNPLVGMGLNRLDFSYNRLDFYHNRLDFYHELPTDCGLLCIFVLSYGRREAH